MGKFRARPKAWRFSSSVLLPIMVAGAAAALMLAALLLYATHQSDVIARERQTQLVSRVVSQLTAKISHDQESVAIWDDAIRNIKLDFDAGWADLNPGVWMFDYFGHDRVFLLSDKDEAIYAMADGARAEPARYASARAAIAPLVAEMRRRLLIAGADAEVTPRAADLVMIDGHPAAASVMPIISDSGDIQQAPGSEYAHVSVRFLDGSFLAELTEQYLFDGARFSWRPDAEWNEAAFPLTTTAGDVLGYFIWRPDMPGRRLINQIAPALGLALVLVSGLIAALVGRLRRASREIETSEAQAQHLAFHDSLTGLPNRAFFNDRLDHALIGMRRTSSRIALLYLDLDRFKQVNDTLGHPAGDELIRVLAQRLSQLVRGEDSVARLGGDEFAIIQTNVTNTADVSALCERIIQTVGRPFELLGNSAFVGVSIGVAISPEAGVDRSELMRKADIALYAAKASGRNGFRIFAQEMDRSVQRRREIERELRRAIDAGDQFCIEYQPLYALDASSIVGVEALLRWKHPRHGLVAPGIFISIAEEAGLIEQIGEWVLRQACEAAARWPIPRIAVNVSAVQFRSPSFASRVLRILDETGLEPQRLELEVTESVLLDSAEISSVTFATLRAAGVRIALDDFGTGYSSLSYLHKFSVDKIKIDRSFVHNIDSAAASDAIVQAMVDLARAMHIEVTAEGVETEEQRDFLQSIGCTELQGFLLSRPMRAEQIDDLFAASLGTVDAHAEARVATAA